MRVWPCGWEIILKRILMEKGVRVWPFSWEIILKCFLMEKSVCGHVVGR